MKSLSLITSILLVFLVGSSTQGQMITKELIRSQGKERSYYLFVPDKLDKSKPAPLIVMLHGSGHTGEILVEKWKDLAKKEGIILVGPDSSDSQSWNVPLDAPDALYDLIEFLKTKYPINARRVYLFGHSAGAVAGLYVALLESEYFAAAAIHAGAMGPNDASLIQRAKRKIPISIYVGTEDTFFPLKDVRATRDLLKANGINVELTEMKGRTHNYYEHADEVNRMAWGFLKVNELGSDPKYEQYRWNK
jgi:poly(3-hydroxybutyrate) depolymerase